MIAVGTAGFTLLGSVVQVPNGDRLMGSLVDSAGEPWARNKRYPHPRETVEEARGLFCNLAVIQVLSAFDWFTAKLLADLCEFAPAIRALSAFQHAHDDSTIDSSSWARASCCATKATQLTTDLDQRIETICGSLEIDLPRDLKNLLPLFHYFRLARNRITHSNAIAGERFVEHARSEALEDSVDVWNRVYSRKVSPLLPEIRQGAPIQFRPHHAVLAGAVCHEFADFLNRASVEAMGKQGMAAMAAYYALFAMEHPFRLESQRLPEAPVNHFLASRYRVRRVSANQTIQLLKVVGVWKTVLARHEKLYGNRT